MIIVTTPLISSHPSKPCLQLCRRPLCSASNPTDQTNIPTPKAMDKPLHLPLDPSGAQLSIPNNLKAYIPSTYQQKPGCFALRASRRAWQCRCHQLIGRAT